MKFLIIVAVIGAVFVSSSSALRCYQCVFPGDAKCQTPGDGLEVCDELNTAHTSLGMKAVCVKSVINAPGGIQQITRSCGRQMSGGQLNACIIFKDNLEHCSTCENDLCNKSSFTTSSIWSTLVPVVIVVFFKFF